VKDAKNVALILISFAGFSKFLTGWQCFISAYNHFGLDSLKKMPKHSFLNPVFMYFIHAHAQPEHPIRKKFCNPVRIVIF
jgi:hypothetical protein